MRTKITRAFGSVVIGLSALTSMTWSVNAQDASTGSANAKTQAPGSGPTPDPNMPSRAGMGNGFSWSYVARYPVPALNPLAPVICFLPEPRCGAQGESNYLGFIDREGSLIEERWHDHAVYLYNGSTHAITKKYPTIDDIPADEFARLRNREFVFNAMKDRSGPPRPQKGNPSGSTHFAAKGQEPDPNLPADKGNDSMTGFPLGWTMAGTSTQPLTVVRLSGNAAGTGLYLGFNARGSWVVSLGNAKVYIWNLASKTMVEGAANWWLAPVDLSNPSPLMQAIVYYDAHEDLQSGGSADESAKDPNLPPSLDAFAQEHMPVRWDYYPVGGPMRTTPLVGASVWVPWNGLGIASGTNGDLGTTYLGFNERGSWVKDGLDGRIYAWDFKTLSVTLLASQLSRIPRDELLTVRKPSKEILDRLAATN